MNVWNKRNDEPIPPQTTPRYQPAPPPALTVAPAPVPAAPVPKHTTAVIGASMHIKGDIRTREELLVDGEVEGAMESQSLLTVGANGKVRANIKAREVVIYGSVRGNVEVSEKLSIREQGSLIGDIKSAGISIDDGAYFKGSIDITRPEPKGVAQPLKPEASKSEAHGLKSEAHAG
jgi:cytoskeletal protein CcmA (bactofilin family)